MQAICNFLLELNFWQWIGLIMLVGAFKPFAGFSLINRSKDKDGNISKNS